MTVLLQIHPQMRVVVVADHHRDIIDWGRTEAPRLPPRNVIPIGHVRDLHRKLSGLDPTLLWIKVLPGCLLTQNGEVDSWLRHLRDRGAYDLPDGVTVALLPPEGP